MVDRVHFSDNVKIRLSPAHSEQLEAAGNAWLQEFREGLERSLRDASLLTDGDTIPSGPVLQVRVMINELDPGAKTARFWVGLASGRGRVTAIATVDGHGAVSVSGEFSGGLLGGALDELMKRLGELAGAEIAWAATTSSWNCLTPGMTTARVMNVLPALGIQFRRRFLKEGNLDVEELNKPLSVAVTLGGLSMGVLTFRDGRLATKEPDTI